MHKNSLVVNAEGPEVRVAVIEDGALAEFFLERKRDRGLVGSIFRGRVNKVLPGLQAAFVDLGPKVERDAFLYVADVMGGGEEDKLFEDADTGDDQDVRKKARKQLAQRKIEQLLRPGQYVLCQVVKDSIGQKGARVTCYISLAGRYGVYLPDVDQVGISRRIGSAGERQRLKELIDGHRAPGSGFIARTAAEDARDQEICDDVDFLAKLWHEVKARESLMSGPGLVYADLDLPLRCVRDLMMESTSELVIDDEEQYERVRKFTQAFLPRFADRIRRYDGRRPVFDFYGIEAGLRAAVGRRVPLRSGGSLVIDQGEALTAIDVNTGSYVGKGNLEDTVTKNNLEAVAEVARQLRLRNIGGIIVIDFVDMDREANRKRVWEALQDALKKDRARCNVTKISELGLVEMTRKRTRESLSQLLTEPCPTCEGAGTVKSVATVTYEVLREVRRSGSMVDNEQIEIECPPRVADELQRLERTYLDVLEKRFQKRITVQGQKSWKPDQFRVAGRMSTDIAKEESEMAPAPVRAPTASDFSNGSAKVAADASPAARATASPSRQPPTDDSAAADGARSGKRRRRGGRGRGGRTAADA